MGNRRVTAARWVIAPFDERITPAWIVARVLLSFAVATCVGCARHPVDRATLDANLVQSAEKGDAKAVLHLLQEGAHVDARDEGGSTALALAADYGHRDVVKLLLDRGADPVAGGLSGEGSLIEAARIGLATKVAFLLERKVDSKVNEALFTMGESAPLILPATDMAAGQVQAQSTHPRPDIDIAKTVELLLDHGADIEARNYNEATPLIWASVHGATEVVKALLDRGADVEAKDKYGETALIGAACECAVIDMPETLESMKLLLKKGGKVNARAKDGGTALMAAASAGRTQNMKLLLDNGAALELRDKDGNTALLISAGAGPYSAVGVVLTVEPVKLLLERGADIEAKNNNGDSALMLAASKGGYEDAATAKVLLNNGADARARNRQGQTALDLALKHRRTATVDLLRKAMASHVPQ